MNRVALVTGLSGQEGFRTWPNSCSNATTTSMGWSPTGGRELCDPRCHLHYGDLTDASRIAAVFNDVSPDEV
ncbi:MAG: hypothetical protein CM1200mP2_01060 [Planctomycetaceae bacterium]|nr:MAG: hypothetical protein CM1200mP2_01060 [Planctomycetaceae bacterium]